MSPVLGYLFPDSPFTTVFIKEMKGLFATIDSQPLFCVYFAAILLDFASMVSRVTSINTAAMITRPITTY